LEGDGDDEDDDGKFLAFPSHWIVIVGELFMDKMTDPIAVF
jgi:hypothetical protein